MRSTQQKKNLKKRVVVEFDIPTTDIVPVEESQTESEREYEEESNEDTVRKIVAQRAKVKAGTILPPKKEMTKGVLIKEPVSTNGSKKKG